MKKPPCDNEEKKKYDDCFDCLTWHIADTRKESQKGLAQEWYCKGMCGSYRAEKPACPNCKKVK